MPEVNIDLSGKVALITGGSRGIGKAAALAMARKGARVVICSRKQENLDKAMVDFRREGFEIMAYPTHVGNSTQVSSLLQAIEGRFGRLDILINNVGTNIFTPAITEAEETLWDRLMETNLKSVFLVSREASRLMKKGGGGKIVNISSVAARKASRGMGIYCVAKAAVEMLTKVMAVELAPDHIHVNAVAPGMVRTQFSQPLWGNEGIIKAHLSTVPMGRIAETEDVVGVILFLASPLSEFITGEVVTVDGGITA